MTELLRDLRAVVGMNEQEMEKVIQSFQKYTYVEDLKTISKIEWEHLLSECSNNLNANKEIVLKLFNQYVTFVENLDPSNHKARLTLKNQLLNEPRSDLASRLGMLFRLLKFDVVRSFCFVFQNKYVLFFSHQCFVFKFVDMMLIKIDCLHLNERNTSCQYHTQAQVSKFANKSKIKC